MHDPLGEVSDTRRGNGDPVQQTLVGSVRVLLIALMALPILIVLLGTFLLPGFTLSTVGAMVLLGVAASAGLGLARLRVGNFGQAVSLVIGATLAALVWETAQMGIVGGFLFAYTVPIAFAALLLGRAALVVTALFSIAAVVGIHLLQQAGVPWVATGAETPAAGMRVIAFSLIIALLALLLERFGVELRIAHAAALLREQDLAVLVRQLENEIEERRQAELERDRSEQSRERLLQRETAARRSAETASARLAFLAEAGHLLASSLEFDETLERIGDLLVPDWADWCAVDLVDEEGSPTPLSVAHVDPEKARRATEMQLRYKIRDESPGPIRAIATGVTQYLPDVTEVDLMAAAQDTEHLRMLRELEIRSLIVVPLVVRGAPFGALTLVSAESGRRYSEDDVLFFEEIAARASVAFDNARLFEQTRSLNQDLEARVEQRTRDLSSALGELEAFNYSIAHDLRSPLRGIDGFSQTLLEDYGGALDVEARGRLERIRSAASRMGNLIDALLSLSNLARRDLEVERVDVTALVSELLDELAKGDPHRSVEVAVQPRLSAKADPTLLQIVFEHLLGNAWKFTRVRKQARIEVGTVEIGGETAYFVRDNGVGFEMAYHDKLFAPFQRLHQQQFEGTGVGLAITQRIVLRHGGRIWAHGRADGGATFYFTLGTDKAVTR